MSRLWLRGIASASASASAAREAGAPLFRLAKEFETDVFAHVDGARITYREEGS